MVKASVDTLGGGVHDIDQEVRLWKSANVMNDPTQADFFTPLAPIGRHWFHPHKDKEV